MFAQETRSAMTSSVDKRAAPRVTVSVPAMIELKGQHFNAVVRDIALRGVLVDTAAPLYAGAELTLRCGRIESEAVVVWHKCRHYGLRFRQLLEAADLTQQLTRTAAIQSRRAQGPRFNLSP